jgi:hypothetical protein
MNDMGECTQDVRMFILEVVDREGAVIGSMKGTSWQLADQLQIIVDDLKDNQGVTIAAL